MLAGVLGAKSAASFGEFRRVSAKLAGMGDSGPRPRPIGAGHAGSAFVGAMPRCVKRVSRARSMTVGVSAGHSGFRFTAASALLRRRVSNRCQGRVKYVLTRANSGGGGSRTRLLRFLLRLVRRHLCWSEHISPGQRCFSTCRSRPFTAPGGRKPAPSRPFRALFAGCWATRRTAQSDFRRTAQSDFET